jgi:phosphatidylserine/phosphatidylglycerophosphate/cardiolipin synthase-like enzyme
LQRLAKDADSSFKCNKGDRSGSKVAQTFYEYWQQISTDPLSNDFRPWNEEHTPVPKLKARAGIQPIFSPRAKLDVLDKYYTKLMDDAKYGVFLTAAFGVNPFFQEIFEKDKPYLRYLLLETGGKNLQVIKRNLNNQIAIGSFLGDRGVVENWLKSQYRDEVLSGENDHVKYIHTKYMLIDPLSDNPIVITGSANFSNASTLNNDENMLVIRGNTRVADIYLGEFMRLFTHFRARGLAPAAKTKEQQAKFLFLCPDDSWLEPFYNTKSSKMKERLLFS